MIKVIACQFMNKHFCFRPMEKKTLTECAHCQQAILEIVPGEGDKVYCCYGCKVVDELMGTSKNLLELPEKSLRSYAYLDEEKIKNQLCHFREGSINAIKIHLPAIHCSSCIYLLENLNEVAPGISDVQVHFPKKEASIQFSEDDIKLSEVATLLEFIGYKPDFISHLGKGKKSKNRLLIQLGIAGFFFGNTMLLALPEYLDDSLINDADLQRFFRYLMMAFSLPVVFFSARDYFVSAFKSLRAGALSIDLPIAMGITVLFLRSSYEVISSLGSGYFDSLTGLVFFLLIGKWYQQMTYQNFSFDRDLRSFLPLAANILLDDGQEKPIVIDDLKKGDRLILRQGEVLSADGILISEKAEIDYSYLSGESLPVQKLKGDKIFAGAKIAGQAIQVEVHSTVEHSYLSSLWAKDAFADASKKKSLAFSDRISQYFTPAILLIALIAALIWSQQDFSKAILVFTSVLIVACPCALALAEPFAAGSMMRWFGKYGFFIKNATVLNRLQSINTVVFDKTGTLTLPNSIQVNWHGDELSFEEKWAVAALALNAQHPLAQPLLHFLDQKKADSTQVLSFEEVSGEGVAARVRGSYYRLGKASFLNLSDQAGTTAVYVERDAVVRGYFSFFQKERPGLSEGIESLAPYYNLAVLSGDNDAERERFEVIFKERAALYFQHSPHDKLDRLKEIQQKGEKVLMLGDGLNDAGALQQSEVGVSLCEKDVNFFPASDALLQSQAFPLLASFLALSHSYRKIVNWAFVISLAYNFIGVAVAVAGLLSPLLAAVLMPISSVTVVLFTTLRSGFMAKKKLSKFRV
jgi:Cu+-exporting ATPase